MVVTSGTREWGLVGRKGKRGLGRKRKTGFVKEAEILVIKLEVKVQPQGEERSYLGGGQLWAPLHWGPNGENCELENSDKEKGYI